MADSFQELKLKAENGDVLSQNKLGVAYALGRGVKIDLINALYWYKKSAENGSISAQFNLGLAHFLGRGTPRNDRNAHLWFSLAVNGDRTAPLRHKFFKWFSGWYLTKGQRTAIINQLQSWKIGPEGGSDL
jgi:hypothetical protein